MSDEMGFIMHCNEMCTLHVEQQEKLGRIRSQDFNFHVLEPKQAKVC